MLTPEQIEAFRVQAMDGTDDDLLPEDRRDRAVILDGQDLTSGQAVSAIWGQPCYVLGPGRGREYVTVVWEDGGAWSIGTLHRDQIDWGAP